MVNVPVDVDHVVLPATFGFYGLDAFSMFVKDEMHGIREGIGVHMTWGTYDNIDAKCGPWVSESQNLNCFSRGYPAGYP